MSERKTMRLVHLLRTLGQRANELLATGAAETSYSAVVSMFNDYARQANDLYGDELINMPRQLDPDAEGADAVRAMAELAVEASQLSKELDLMVAEAADETEDWADALVRLAEAGVDVSEVMEHIEGRLDARGLLRKDWVDRLIKLAEAGVDVEDVLEHSGSWMEVGGGTSPRPRAPGRHGSHSWHPYPQMPRRPTHGRHFRPSPRITVDTPERDTEAVNKAWQTEILSRVEKGDITPEEGARLLEQGITGDS